MVRKIKKPSKANSASKPSYYESFMAMTPAERDAEVAKYNGEDLNPGMPLTAADKAMHGRAAARTRANRLRTDNGEKIVPH
jgi:hypothetical protein